jgi:chemotaxis signal transduction protein
MSKESTFLISQMSHDLMKEVTAFSEKQEDLYFDTQEEYPLHKIKKISLLILKLNSSDSKDYLTLFLNLLKEALADPTLSSHPTVIKLRKACSAFSIQEKAPQEEAKTAHLLFHLNNHTYAVPSSVIMKVHHVKKLSHSHEFSPLIAGTIEFGQNMLQVIDLRLKLGIQANVLTEKAGILIIKGKQAELACLVDSLGGFIHLNKDQIDPPMDLARADSRLKWITGIIRAEEKTVFLLNLEGVLINE